MQRTTGQMREVSNKKFCFWCRAPQQMLRTHRSLEAYCATYDEDEDD
jgi:hypothetical protein